MRLLLAAALAGLPVPAAIPPAQAQAASPASAWVTVTTAQDIVGRTLRDPGGNEAGRVAGLVLDLDSGIVLYALVGSSGSFDVGADYVAVPFSAMTLGRGIESVNVKVAVDKILKAPRVDQAHLAELGQSDRIGAAASHYAIPTPLGFVLPPTDARPHSQDRFMLVQPGQAAPLGAGRDLASNVRGADVKLEGGEVIGTIDRVMIDPAAMRVAYLLVTQGGFLGLGEEWVPVPSQALVWSEGEGAYVLKGAKVLEQVQGLRKGEPPAQVRRKQLAKLYGRFGVKPYWAGS